MTVIDAAQRRHERALEQWRKTNDAYNAAAAELFRVQALDLLEQHPAVTGLELEITHEYSSGDYFDSVDVRPLGNGDDVDSLAESGELIDVRPEADVVRWIAEQTGDSVNNKHEEKLTVTLDQLKAASW